MTEKSRDESEVEAGSDAPPAAPAGLRARLLLVAVVLLAPVVFLGLAEGVLRLAGYGGDRDLIISFEQVPGWLQVNPAVGTRYFAEAEAHLPTFEVFPADRRPDDVLLVFQGASTGVGFPFGASAAPARVVEHRLSELMPERRIEVVNTSLTAVNSYTLLDLADEIAELRPDAVLVYAGHNEFYGAFGVASSRSVGRRRPLVMAYLALSELRVFQLLRDLVHALGVGGWAASPPTGDEAARVGGGPAGERGAAGGSSPSALDETPMDRMAGDEAIPLGSELYRAGLAQYRANLSALLSLYESRGIPVLVATLVSNESGLAPFVGGPVGPVDTARWMAARRTATRAVGAGDTTAAREAVDALLALDSLAADPWFLKGRIEAATGDTAAARASYIAARDRDQLRFRAPSAFNRIVREEAAEHGARVVEVEAAFRRAAPGGVVGSGLITEHVHPDLPGYALLADAFLRALREAGIPDGWEDAPPLEAPGDRPPLVTALDSVRGAYRLRALLQGWPFQPRDRQRALEVTPETVEDSLALAIYERRMLWMQAMSQLGSRYEASGRTEDAYRVARAMAAEFPVVPHFFVAAARLAVELGRPEDAERLIRRARERGQLAGALTVEARIRLGEGDRDEALRLLRRAAGSGEEAAIALLDSLGAGGS